MNVSSTTYARDLKITAKEADGININCPVPFLRHSERRTQSLLIDTPDELYYNPSTKTLHADNFQEAYPVL